MLTDYSHKAILAPGHAKSAGPPAPGAPRGRCPACGAVGPLVVDRRRGRPHPAVLGCRCLHPPTPIPEGTAR